MSWLAQVAHVMVKDMAESRRLLAVYVLLVVLATGRALGWALLSHAVLGSVVLLVALAGVFLVAVVVQADSPTRSDAFWATHPLRATAVAGAKVAFALLVLAIGLAGHTIAVQSYEVQGLALLSLVARTIPIHGAWLLAAMITAALVRDVRSFVLAAVLIPIAMLVAGFIGDTIGWGITINDVRTDPTPGNGAVVIGVETLRLAVVLGGLAVLAWLYRTRDVRLRTRVAGVAVVMLTLVTSLAGSSAASDPEPSTVERVPLALELLHDGLRTDGGELRLNLRAAAVPSDVRLILTKLTFAVGLRDGTEMRVRSDNYSFLDLGMMEVTPLPRLEGVRWLGVQPSRELNHTIDATLSPEQRRAIRVGVASLTLEGRVIVTEARTIATMPLATGSSLTADGRRIRIEEWTHEFAEPRVRLLARVVGDPSHPLFSRWSFDEEIQAAVVNPVRGEGVPLRFRGGGGGIEGLVLLGTPYRELAGSFVADWPGLGSPSPQAPRVRALDAAWFQEAHLLLTTRVVRGSYPLRLELNLP